MPTRDLVVVGASAGGVAALKEFVASLPQDLPAAVLVVLHLPTSAYSALSSILTRAGKLPAEPARDGEPLTPGRILVAPPDRHLLVRDGKVVLRRGPRENGHRPGIDPLFRSAARWHGPQTVGVVLTGTLDDGAAGLFAIAARGGAAVVQDPDDALYDGMPRAALRIVPDAIRVAIGDLGCVVADLCRETVAAAPSPDAVLQMETEIAEFDLDALAADDRPGHPAGVICPDCNGAMFEIDEGSTLRFRCRVGHAWSPDSLAVAQVEAAESALWAAVRTLEEKAALHRRLAGHAHDADNRLSVGYHQERAREAKDSAAVLREMLRLPLTGDMDQIPAASGQQS